MRYIVCGKAATHLSETVDMVYIGGQYQWGVAQVNGYFSCREEAFGLAREWFPDLVDDEN